MRWWAWSIALYIARRSSCALMIWGAVPRHRYPHPICRRKKGKLKGFYSAHSWATMPPPRPDFPAPFTRLQDKADQNSILLLWQPHILHFTYFMFSCTVGLLSAVRTWSVDRLELTVSECRTMRFFNTSWPKQRTLKLWSNTRISGFAVAATRPSLQTIEL